MIDIRITNKKGENIPRITVSNVRPSYRGDDPDKSDFAVGSVYSSGSDTIGTRCRNEEDVEDKIKWIIQKEIQSIDESINRLDEKKKLYEKLLKGENGKIKYDRLSPNPYIRLRECTNVDIIDDALDEIGLPELKKERCSSSEAEMEKRLLFLYDIMGVKQVFGTDKMDIKEKYVVAKEELASQAWKKF